MKELIYLLAAIATIVLAIIPACQFVFDNNSKPKQEKNEDEKSPYTEYYESKNSQISLSLNKTVMICDESFSVTYTGKANPSSDTPIIGLMINGEKWRFTPGYVGSQKITYPAGQVHGSGRVSLSEKTISVKLIYLEFLEKGKPLIRIECQWN